MERFIVLILISLVLSCTSSRIIKPGEYVSECYIQLEPQVILEVSSDGVFSYKLAYNENPINGVWLISNDTLILNSEQFVERNGELKPITKLTSYNAYADYFLIRKKVLVSIDKNGIISNKCKLFYNNR